MWNLDSATEDDDEIAFVKSRMKEKQNPDGIVELTKRDDIPKAIIQIISKGLGYDKNERPSALEMLQVFKSM